MEGVCVCMCMCERERMSKVVLCSLILNVGRGMTSWEEMDQRFIGPTFSLKTSSSSTFSDVVCGVPVTLCATFIPYSV